MSQISERSGHPNIMQLEMLLGELEANPEIARGFLKTANAKQRARAFWEEMQTKLNSVGGGSAKTWKQWMKYWSDKKSFTKKKVALRAANRHQTGGGLGLVVELTVIEERIVALMGGETFATGDSHLRFPFINEPSEISHPSRAEQSTPPNYLCLHGVNLSTENTLETRTTSEPITLPATSQINIQAPLANIAEIESPSLLQGTPMLQTTSSPPQYPPQSSTNFSASATSSPRRRRIRARASPPSQRQNLFARTTERFLRLEERRLNMEETNASLLRAAVDSLTNVGNRMVDQQAQSTDRMADAIKTFGEGLKALSDAIKEKTAPYH